ncbi:MAG: hypothetical protein WCJ35_13380 [Planctomycetota bacterium]
MMNRRRFLSTGMIGAGLVGTPGLVAASMVKPSEPVAQANTFNEKWARADLESLGIPKSWWHVQQGLFPFSPERVLVIKKRPSDRGFRPLKEKLLQSGFGGNDHFSEEKLDYALWITHKLTTCYHVPEYFEPWGTKLAAREDLGAGMGLSGHVGIVHQFQPASGSQSVPTTNGPLDWWLVLIPGGVDFQSLDDLPTHVLFGLVLADSGKDFSLYVPWCGCLSTIWKTTPDWTRVSQMDRLMAARYLNRRLVDVM